MVTTRRAEREQQQQQHKAAASAAGKKHQHLDDAEDHDQTGTEAGTDRAETKKVKLTGPWQGKDEGKHGAAAGKAKAAGEAGARPRKAAVEDVADVDVPVAKETGDAAPTQTDASSRAQAVAESPILEKGLVYFFLRGKVGVERPESLDQVKRSYLVLRPLPAGKTLAAGAEAAGDDGGRSRLLAIPKKRLPAKGHEKFLTFVEEPHAGLHVLREKYLKGRTYQTRTQGERTDYPAEPVGEGVYALAKADDERQSHFVYMLTMPTQPSELQRDLGVRSHGSFVVSVRNPTAPAPPNAGLSDPAEFPQEMIDDFRGLKWGAVQPAHLDHKNAEVLFIGETTFPHEGEHQATAAELGLLEDEDEKRVSRLGGTESIFADLELSRSEFLGIQTVWG